MTSHWEWKCGRVCMSWKEKHWWRQEWCAEVYQPWTMKQIKRPHAYPGYLRSCQRPRIDRGRVLWARMPFFTDGPNGAEEIILQRSECGWERHREAERDPDEMKRVTGKETLEEGEERGGVSWTIVIYWSKSQGMLDVVGNESRDLYAEFLLLLKKNSVEGNYFRMRAHRSWILDNTNVTNRAVSLVQRCSQQLHWSMPRIGRRTYTL